MSSSKAFYNNYDITPLNDEEFIELWYKYKSGDKSARDRIVVHNLKLIYKIVSDFNSYNINEDDLISIGVLTVIRCLNNYDISKNYKFSTYISKCVRNDILEYIIKQQKNNCFSLDEPFGDDLELNYLDIFPDEIDVESLTCDSALYGQVIDIINEFPQRERNIMYDYFINYDECSMSMEEIGNKHGIKKARVSKIIIRHLNIIRERLNINRKTM